jgi:hypothetical protein
MDACRLARGSVLYDIQDVVIVSQGFLIGTLLFGKPARDAFEPHPILGWVIIIIELSGFLITRDTRTPD